VLDERPRCEVELALLVAPVYRLGEARVEALLAGILGCPERDLRRHQDRRVEQDEPVDGAAVRRGPLEGEPAAERVSEPGTRVTVDRRFEVRQVVADPPGRLA